MKKGKRKKRKRKKRLILLDCIPKMLIIECILERGRKEMVQVDLDILHAALLDLLLDIPLGME
jgi:hypothetical protein